MKKFLLGLIILLLSLILPTLAFFLNWIDTINAVFWLFGGILFSFIGFSLMPSETKQAEIIWKPVFDEYRRINYRLKSKEQIKLF